MFCWRHDHVLDVMTFFRVKINKIWVVGIRHWLVKIENDKRIWERMPHFTGFSWNAPNQSLLYTTHKLFSVYLLLVWLKNTWLFSIFFLVKNTSLFISERILIGSTLNINNLATLQSYLQLNYFKHTCYLIFYFITYMSKYNFRFFFSL
jgi:hypothetical protein